MHNSVFGNYGNVKKQNIWNSTLITDNKKAIKYVSKSFFFSGARHIDGLYFVECYTRAVEYMILILVIKIQTDRFALTCYSQAI